MLIKKIRILIYFTLIYIFYYIIKLSINILSYTLKQNKVFNTYRLNTLKKIIKKNFKKKISVLEIGTHFGLGSTQTIIKNIPRNSVLTCVDSWNHKIITVHDYMVPFLSAVLNIKNYRNIEVNLLRSNSKFVNKLKKNSFDLIYIDGSHHYKDVLQDIKNAKNLSKKKFSIICGDDCELPKSKENLKFAKNLVKKNVEQYKRNDKIFHPGVYLAVHTQFKDVINEKGFWYTIVRK